MRVVLEPEEEVGAAPSPAISFINVVFEVRTALVGPQFTDVAATAMIRQNSQYDSDDAL
ncbi:hypothetical protein E4U40_004031 [Claviceps sp. LM458 group G5]|nr:hypothetical protein E4U40_004031 [Claviceps sp. LM458 group G5]